MKTKPKARARRVKVIHAIDRMCVPSFEDCAFHEWRGWMKANFGIKWQVGERILWAYKPNGSILVQTQKELDGHNPGGWIDTKGFMNEAFEEWEANYQPSTEELLAARAAWNAREPEIKRLREENEEMRTLLIEEMDLHAKLNDCGDGIKCMWCVFAERLIARAALKETP